MQENKDFKPCKNVVLWSELKTDGFNPKKWRKKKKKKRPTLEPNSLNISPCQGQHSFTVVYQTLFQNRRFWTCVASPWVHRIQVGSNFCSSKLVKSPFQAGGTIIYICLCIFAFASALNGDACDPRSRHWQNEKQENIGKFHASRFLVTLLGVPCDSQGRNPRDLPSSSNLGPSSLICLFGQQ